MSIKVNRSELVTALRALRVAVNSHAVLPVLNNVLIESSAPEGEKALVLTTTNLEVFAKRIVAFEGDADFKSITVPAKAFGDFAGGFRGDSITLKVDDKLRLSSGRQKASLAVIDADEFPAFPKMSDSKSFTLSREEFDAIVGRVTGFAATDTARPILTGVQLRGNGETIRAAAADNYRVGVLTVDHPAELDIVVPASSLQAAAKVIGGAYVTITTDGRMVQLAGESGILVSRLIEGQYPNIDPILPKDFQATLLVGQDEFESAAKLAGLATAQIVKFEQTDTGLRVFASDFDRDFDTSLETTVSIDAPKDIHFSLDQRFVNDIASVFGDSTQVEVGYSGALAPVAFRDPDDASFRAVIMPVRTPS